MRKIVYLLSVVLLLLSITACSSNSDKRSLEEIVRNYRDAGIEVDISEKPMFSLIGAVDGVIFYHENQKVAIYEYKSEKELKDARSSNSLIADWASNGKFLIETNNEEALEIFKNAK